MLTPSLHREWTQRHSASYRTDFILVLVKKQCVSHGTKTGQMLNKQTGVVKEYHLRDHVMFTFPPKMADGLHYCTAFMEVLYGCHITTDS